MSRHFGRVLIAGPLAILVTAACLGKQSPTGTACLGSKGG
jgi:hypothetical protein